MLYFDLAERNRIIYNIANDSNVDISDVKMIDDIVTIKDKKYKLIDVTDYKTEIINSITRELRCICEKVLSEMKKSDIISQIEKEHNASTSFITFYKNAFMYDNNENAEAYVRNNLDLSANIINIGAYKLKPL